MSCNRSIRRCFVGSDRRWDRYNRSLVNRVYDLLNPESMKNWMLLLREINNGKRGRPFKVPHTIVLILAKLKALFNIPFRSLESIARVISSITGMPAISYSRIFKRIRNIKALLDTMSGHYSSFYCEHK
jgi:hypothetical protein